MTITLMVNHKKQLLQNTSSGGLTMSNVELFAEYAAQASTDSYSYHSDGHLDRYTDKHSYEYPYDYQDSHYDNHTDRG